MLLQYSWVKYMLNLADLEFTPQEVDKTLAKLLKSIESINIKSLLQKFL